MLWRLAFIVAALKRCATQNLILRRAAVAPFQGIPSAYRSLGFKINVNGSGRGRPLYTG